VRAFIALPLIETAPVLGAIETMRPTLPGLKWVGPEVLHVTLAFLGEIEPSFVEAVTGAVAEAAAGIPPIRAKFGGMTQFPEKGPLRVLALLVGDPEGSLAAFYQRVNERVEAAAKKAGLPPLNQDWFVGKPFVPHLTLARVARGGRDPGPSWRQATAGLGGVLEAPVVFARCIVYQSELRREGPVHTALARFELKESDHARG
jgi:RNA 2',3'-cyclic 3'-phosphodiesterase